MPSPTSGAFRRSRFLMTALHVDGSTTTRPYPLPTAPEHGPIAPARITKDGLPTAAQIGRGRCRASGRTVSTMILRFKLKI